LFGAIDFREPDDPNTTSETFTLLATDIGPSLRFPGLDENSFTVTMTLADGLQPILETIPHSPFRGGSCGQYHQLSGSARTHIARGLCYVESYPRTVAHRSISPWTASDRLVGAKRTVEQMEEKSVSVV
jgi:hypothetical protein